MGLISRVSSRTYRHESKVAIEAKATKDASTIQVSQAGSEASSTGENQLNKRNLVHDLVSSINFSANFDNLRQHLSRKNGRTLKTLRENTFSSPFSPIKQNHFTHQPRQQDQSGKLNFSNRDFF